MKKFFKNLATASISIALISLPRLVSAQAWTNALQQVGFASGLPATPITEILINIMNFLLLTFTLIAVIAFVVYGLMYILSGTEATSKDNAKMGVGNAILGIAVGLSGYIIINLVNSLLGYGSGGGDGFWANIGFNFSF